MFKLTMKSLVVAALLGSASASQAATITIVEVLDLNTINRNGNQFSVIRALSGGPVTVQAGDIVDFTQDFTGNQTLRVFDPYRGFVGPFAMFGFGYANTTSTVTYLNASGASIGSFTRNHSFGSSIPNPGDLDAATIATGPGLVEFSGIRMVVQVNNFREITHLGFNMQGSSVGVGSFSSPVSEPASLALLGGGLLGIAGLRRRRAL